MTARWAQPLAVLIVLIGMWQLGAFHAVFGLREFQLPYPLQIAQAMFDRADVLWRDATLYTGPEAVVGLLLGGLAGFGCAVLFASAPFLRRGGLPIAASLNSIPIIAISPIAVLWFGFGQPSKIAVVALMTFAPMVINAFNSGADSYMTDFEDSNAPSWSNQIQGQINLGQAGGAAELP